MESVFIDLVDIKLEPLDIELKPIDTDLEPFDLNFPKNIRILVPCII